jgi:hypothetical protein
MFWLGLETLALAWLGQMSQSKAIGEGLAWLWAKPWLVVFFFSVQSSRQ